MLLLLLLGLLSSFASAQDAPNMSDPESELNRLLLTYSPHQRPRNDGDGPVEVRVNMFVNSFSSVSMVDMDYTVDFMLRQRWRDSRLNISAGRLSLGYMKEKLWIPDLFFRNAKVGQLHTLTTPNYLIWLEAGGDLLFSQKLTVKFSCAMRLWNFPMDTQRCKLEMGSYGYSTRDLILTWWGQNNTDQVTLSETLHLNEFATPKQTTGVCHKGFSKTGEFTCLYVDFLLVRKFAFYLTYTYLPSTLVLIISWLSFLLDSKAVPARISIGLLSVLALMTQSAATLQQLPRVSYIKAIDVWMFACLAFVVLSLLEFAIVNSIDRRTCCQRRPARKPREEPAASHEGKENNEEEDREVDVTVVELTALKMLNNVDEHCGSNCSSRRSSRRHRPKSTSTPESARLALMVDKCCVVAFPLTFALFNAAYWTHYSPPTSPISF